MKNLYRFNEFLLEDAKISIGDFAEDLISSMGDMKTLAEEAQKKANDISELKDSPLKEKDTRKELVGKLQDALVKLGHQTDPGANRGSFGPKTKEAVNKYQKEKGLEETGEVNEELMKSILKDGGDLKNKEEGIPFKTKDEGNAFRKWVRKEDKAYAEEIDLDEEGRYDNSIIKKAWEKYGKDYKKSQEKK